MHISFGLQWIEQINIQQLMRLLVNVLALCCGLLVGALGWKLYTLFTHQGIVVPSIAFPNVPDPQNPGWGRWIDLTVSIPPLTTQKKEPKIQVAPLKPITNQIILEGIIGVGYAGVAIMRVDNGNESVYNQGDEISAGVVLTRIDANSITLANSTSERQYFFPESTGLSSLLQSQNISLLSQPTEDVGPINKVNTPVTQPTTRTKSTIPTPKPVTPQVAKTLQEVREKPLTAANLGDVRFVRQNGASIGLQVRNFRNPELFAVIGLQPNDIVLRVNGTSVITLASDPVAAQQMLKEQNFVIEILRGGTEKTLNFSWPR